MKLLDPLQNLRGWTLVVAMIALIPLVALGASATQAEEAPASERDHARAPLVSLHFERDGRPEAEPGAELALPYVVGNDGRRAIVVRVEAHAERALALASDANTTFRLEPGERAWGRVVVRAGEDAPFLGIVRLEAHVEGHDRAWRAVAMMPVVVPPRVAPVELPRVEPLVARPWVEPAAPAPCPVTLREPLRLLRAPCALELEPRPMPACAPCWSPPPPCEPHAHPVHDAALLRAFAHARLVDGQLVIDVDALPPALVRLAAHEERAPA